MSPENKRFLIELLTNYVEHGEISFHIENHDIPSYSQGYFVGHEKGDQTIQFYGKLPKEKRLCVDPP